MTWCLWLLGSFLFSFGRVMLGLYHIFRISVNIVFFIWSSLLLRLSSWARSFHTARDELSYRLEQSNSYDEWFSIGAKLDEICGGNEWRATEDTEDYQWIYLKEYIFRLKEARKNANLKKLVFLLRWCCDRNFASISKQALYNKAFSGTKILIDEFEEEIENVLRFLTMCSKSQEFSVELEDALSDRNVLKPSPSRDSRHESVERQVSFSKESSIYSGNSAALTREEESFVDLVLEGESDECLFGLDEVEGILLSEEDRGNADDGTGLGAGEGFYGSEPEPPSSDDDGGGGGGGGDSFGHRKRLSCSSRGGGVYFRGRDFRGGGSFASRDVSVQTCGWCLGEVNGQTQGGEPDPSIAAQECFCSFKEREGEYGEGLARVTSVDGRWISDDCGYCCEQRDDSRGRNLTSHCSFETGTGSALRYSRSQGTLAGNSLIHYLELLGHSTGKTALCLSGGGALAMYHLGVVKVLLEQNIMPKIINGTSGGSIVAALLATKSDEEILNEYIKPTVSSMHGHRWFPPLLDQIRHFLVKGYMIDPKDFIKTCQTYFKNYTFYEAYRLTGRIVTITVSSTHVTPEFTEPLVLNCVTTPDILLWSAVAASCALPGLMPVAELFAKENHTNRIIRYFPPGMKWMDGSISQDIPHKELSTLFNVRQFIVSQVNPHHVPFVSINPINTNIVHPERTFLQNVLNWLTLDIKYRYTKLAKLKLIPKLFGKDVSNFWMLQEIEGHVTITPRVSLFDWYRCINHPSYDDMIHFITEGERRTWPHVMRIKHMNFLERTIKDTIRNIKYGTRKK